MGECQGYVTKEREHTMKGRVILATIDVRLKQVSDEDAAILPADIVQEWCDQVQVESLWVLDDEVTYDAKFDVDTMVVVRVVDSEEADDDGIEDAVVIE